MHVCVLNIRIFSYKSVKNVFFFAVEYINVLKLNKATTTKFKKKEKNLICWDFKNFMYIVLSFNQRIWNVPKTLWWPVLWLKDNTSFACLFQCFFCMLCINICKYSPFSLLITMLFQFLMIHLIYGNCKIALLDSS